MNSYVFAYFRAEAMPDVPQLIFEDRQVHCQCNGTLYGRVCAQQVAALQRAARTMFDSIRLQPGAGFVGGVRCLLPLARSGGALLCGVLSVATHSRRAELCCVVPVRCHSGGA